MTSLRWNGCKQHTKFVNITNLNVLDWFKWMKNYYILKPNVLGPNTSICRRVHGLQNEENLHCLGVHFDIKEI